ncbi:hypothetical protein ACFSJW_17820 [Flavobacterium artemisiae]|uniref:Uncharacterized protein n=1 Tax=Flavobacterium artemisiae TaxID=2126556 RepID=A0ABW4H9J6_9FLAO
MRIYLGYFFYFILFSISSSAQRNITYSGLLLEKANNYTGQNFKGSVKTVYLKAYAINKSLTNSERSDFMMNNDVRGHKYVRFDNHGRIEETLGATFGESYIIDINKKKSRQYKYDESDWNEKSKQEIKLKQYYPISNHNLLIKVNKIEIPKDTVIIGDKIWEEYSEDVYKYIYNKNGQILEEQEYIFYRVAPVIESKIPVSDDLFTRKLFFYNDSNQVVNQKIVGGHLSQKMAYTDMGTQSNF